MEAVGKPIRQEPKAYNAQQQEAATTKCRLEEAEKLVKSLNQKRLENLQKVDQLKCDKKKLTERLECLGYRKYEDRQRGATWTKEKLDHLRLALDKLTFANHAYHDRAIASTEEEINFHKLNFQLKHGRNRSLANEKWLFRQTKNTKGHTSTEAIAVSCPTAFEHLNRKIMDEIFQFQLYVYGFQCGTQCICKDKDVHKSVVEMIKQLKLTRENAIANATVKGTIWNSLPSKKALQNYIFVLNKESEELRKKQIALRARIKSVEREVEGLEKRINTLQKQVMIGNRRKGVAYRCILLLTKQLEEHDILQ